MIIRVDMMLVLILPLLLLIAVVSSPLRVPPSAIFSSVKPLKPLGRLLLKTNSLNGPHAVKYIQDEELRALGVTPLVSLVNKKSGGGVGRKVLKALRAVLDEVQVCDVHTEKSSDFLERFKKCEDIMKVLVCGGDGTVSRVVGELFDKNMSQVPVMVVPTGTGNDLVNILWNTFPHTESSDITVEGFCNDPASALAKSVKGKEYEIDVWNIKRHVPLSYLTHNISTLENSSENRNYNISIYSKWLRSLSRKKSYSDRTMVNYFSLGVDSHVSLDFDALRQLRPRLFMSQLINKLWYGILGLKVLLSQPELELSSLISLACDGVPVIIPEGTKGIVILNVDSYAGGTKIWECPLEENSMVASNRAIWKDSSPNDGLLEVIAVEGLLHLGAIKSGLTCATRIAQGRCLELETKKRLPMQIDGEPFVQTPVKMTLTRRGSVRFLIPGSS